jgi:LysM repeat protein
MRRRELLLVGLGLLVSACSPRGYRYLNTPGRTYIIQPGDTLARIAGDHGTTVTAILQCNNLPDGELPIGRVIFIPGGRPPPPRVVDPSITHDYVLIRREEWGARPTGRNHDPMQGISAITIHHTSEYDGMRGDSDPEAVRTICAIHRERHGWADIGYHYLIGRDGRVYEGRPVTIQGAHCGGTNNQHNLGISLIGDFSHRPPTGVQEQTALRFLRAMQRQYGIPTERIYGHRDFNGSLTRTVCPGDAGYRWLQEFRRHERTTVTQR